jgi:superfamily II DNA/RNA helicase
MEVETEVETKVETWDDLDIKNDLLRGIYSYGFEKPSEIQCKACGSLFEGRDVLAQAQSGTGKTGAFVIGALNNIDVALNKSQVLIMAPTRELALQIITVQQELGSMIKGLKNKLLVGGHSSDNDIYDLKRNTPHIIIGTPGRVYDMFKRNIINTRDIKMVVLDEADEMLSYGFKEQLFVIFQYLKKDIQIALFSATLPDSIVELTKTLLKNPVNIVMKTEQLVLDGIKQFFVSICDDKQKFDVLTDLFERLVLSQTIIYCNSVGRVNELYEAMKNENYPVCSIHSDMNKEQRKESFDEFKRGKYRVLISSNVTARGIDIQQVNIVINFDLPRDPHTYLHRIGRSGRWGRKGIGINFVTPRDVSNLKFIENHYGIMMEELPSNFESIVS